MKKKKSIDEIQIKGHKQFRSFNYVVPSDPSSCAFFIVLTLISNNSRLIIKNVNVIASNPNITAKFLEKVMNF